MKPTTLEFKKAAKGKHTHVRFTYDKDREKKIITKEVHEKTYPNESDNAKKTEYLIVKK